MGPIAIFLMPEYTALDLLLLALAALYTTHVITQTEGPFYVFRRLRDKTRRYTAGLLGCPWCTVVWVALILFFLHQFAPGVTWILATAGAAMALRSYTGTGHGS